MQRFSWATADAPLAAVLPPPALAYRSLTDLDLGEHRALEQLVRVDLAEARVAQQDELLTCC